MQDYNPEEPGQILAWAQNVEPEGFASKTKLEADRFFASYLSTHVRVAHRVMDAVNSEAIDETDDLDA